MGPLATMGAADDFLRDLETIEGDPGIDTLVRTRRLPGGAFVTPSMHRVREHTEGARRYLQTELFAPNLAVEVVDDDDAALEVARASAFGLSLGVFTRDEARFERFVHGAPWGLFNHNRSTNNASGLLPFGGLGFSGNHRPAGSTSALYCSRAIGVLQKDWGRFDPDPRYASVLDGLIE